MRERKQAVAVRRAILPPGGGDLALLELATSLDVQAVTRRSGADASPPIGVVTHLGYGAQDPDGRTGFGKKNQMLLNAEGWGCGRLAALTTGCDVATEMHIRGAPGRDTCRGDSGGAVFEFIARPGCMAADGSPAFEPRLIAVTSRSAAGARRACGEGGIYTRVDVLSGWLDGVLNTLNEPTQENLP